MLDNRLTIILIIRDRPHYTLRWMSYADKCSLPFKIFIADGGKDEQLQSQLSDTSHYPNINYDYLRYPYDATFSDYYAKIYDALLKVTTPYAVLADDDDFYLTDGLLAAIDFLETHDEYVACAGQTFAFKNHRQKWRLYHNVTSDVYRETALERVNQVCCSKNEVFYEIQRTVDLQNTWKIISQINPSNLFLVGFFHTTITAAKGKVKRLSCGYLLKEGWHGDSTSQKEPDIFDVMMGNNWSANFTSCIDQLSSTIAKIDGIHLTEANKSMQKIFKNFIAYRLIDCLYKDTNVSTHEFLVNIQTWLTSKNQEKPLVRKLIRLLLNTKNFCKLALHSFRFSRKNPEQQKILLTFKKFTQ